MSMYTDAKTVVRTVYGNSKSFEVKFGMHQGSALSCLVPAHPGSLRQRAVEQL